MENLILAVVLISAVGGGIILLVSIATNHEKYVKENLDPKCELCYGGGYVIFDVGVHQIPATCSCVTERNENV